MKTKNGRRVVLKCWHQLEQSKNYMPKLCVGDIIIPPHLLEYTMLIVNEMRKAERLG